MIKYIKGDLLKLIPDDKSIKLIPHVANDQKIMGAGIALGLSKKWPIVKELNKSTKLGDVEFITTTPYTVVANMISQEGLFSRNNPTPIRYKALSECMLKVKDYIKEHSTLLGKMDIYTVKFGSGLAKGNWVFIENLIDEIWKDIDVNIYEL
jgi:O-acetyl-ADP-ribose deacetylase (regulator of RNase III)